MIRHLLFTMMLAMLLVLTACGGGEQVTEPNEEPAVEQKDKDDRPIETDEEQGQSDGQADDQNEEVLTETGIYNGQADVHTIEIETDDGPVAFQLSMGARDHVDKLTEDEKVTYTYREDGDERVIKSIEPIE